MKKKLVVVLLCMAMVASMLVACGKKDDTSPSYLTRLLQKLKTLRKKMMQQKPSLQLMLRQSAFACLPRLYSVGTRMVLT
jgi:outer membrane lipoprotein-sorting protein